MDIKIPFYHLVNVLLTGLVFIGGCAILLPEHAAKIFREVFSECISVGLETMVVICFLAIAYELGLLINRVGSDAIEYCLRKCKLIPFNEDYKLFNERKKQYPILDILSREYALSRTRIALFLILSILAFVTSHWVIGFICVLILVIYFISCWKHAFKIVNLMGD